MFLRHTYLLIQNTHTYTHMYSLMQSWYRRPLKEYCSVFGTGPQYIGKDFVIKIPKLLAMNFLIELFRKSTLHLNPFWCTSKTDITRGLLHLISYCGLGLSTVGKSLEVMFQGAYLHICVASLFY